jgi:hypothetical protein
MNELELLLLTGVLTSNFNTMDLVKILEKNSKTSHLDRSSHIEGDVMENHEQKKKVKKSEKPRFYGQNKLFFENLPFNIGQFQCTATVSAACRSYMKNELNTCFQQKFATNSYRVGIGRAWCLRKACEICSSLV